MPTKKTAGAFIGVLAVGAILIYVYNVPSKKYVPRHAMPRVGRGYATTPYGEPAGNPRGTRARYEALGRSGALQEVAVATPTRGTFTFEVLRR